MTLKQPKTRIKKFKGSKPGEVDKKLNNFLKSHLTISYQCKGYELSKISSRSEIPSANLYLTYVTIEYYYIDHPYT